MEEDNTQREDTKEEGAGDRQPVGENSLMCISSSGFFSK